MRRYYFPPKAPLGAKFGFYFGHFAQLPTVEEFFRFKTLQTEGGLSIQELDISSALSSMQCTQDDELVIEVPILVSGSEDINPCFSYPIAINGYVADVKSPWLSSAQIYVKDFAGYFYPFKWHEINHANDLKMAFFEEKMKGGLQSIGYCYSKTQVIQGEGLYPLPLNTIYKNKLFLCVPHIKTTGTIKMGVRHSLTSHGHSDIKKTALFSYTHTILS